MSRVELPGGEWAELRDPRKVSERLRRPILAAQADLRRFGVPGDMESTGAGFGAAMTAYGELNDLMVVALVSAWSLESPVSLESVLDLPGDVYDALRQAVAPFTTDLLPDFGPTVAADSPTGA